MRNLFYFSYINKIGGIEQFFAYLTDKYKDWDITIVYKSGDNNQLARLRKYAKVVRFTGQTFTCDKAFFCFNTDIREYVKAKEYILCLHGDYKAMVEQGQLSIGCYIFKEEFDKYVGVSKQVCDSWTAMTGKECVLAYNPIVVTEPKKILKLVYCGRLTDEKGGVLAQALINRMNERGVDYQLFVYSDKESIKGDNVIQLKTRLDAGQLLNKDNYDYLIVPSKNEGYCYSLVQALCNGLPCIVTPCPVFKELGVNDSNSILLDFDGSNVDEVIDKALKSNLNFTYEPKKDGWDKLLEPGKSTYEYHNVTVQAIQKYFDLEEGIQVQTGDIYSTTLERAKLLTEGKFAIRIKED